MVQAGGATLAGGGERKSSGDEIIWFCLPVIAGFELGMDWPWSLDKVASFTVDGLF